MNKNVKKVCAGTLMLSILGTTGAAFANEWKKVGYDTSAAAVGTGRYACVYQEVDAYGIPTGNVKSGYEVYALNLGLQAFANSALWKNSFVDRTHFCSVSSYNPDDPTYSLFCNHDQLPAHDCGNLEYATLVLDGEDQKRVTATGAYGNVEYRWDNWFWEKAEPYKIYQKQKVNFGDGNWYTDDTYPMRYSGENEKVIVSQPQVYINEDSLPIRGTVNENGVEVLDATGNETLFNKSVEKLYQRTLTGTSIPVSVFDDVTYPNAGLFTNGLTADATWVDAGYESEAPYRSYQILSLDGYLMDGSKIVIQTNDPANPIVITKPYIYRYTGGFAKPTITYTDYKIDLSSYNSVDRTAKVIATIVLDGVKTENTAYTGEYATFNYREVYDDKNEVKSVEGTFTARVNQNGEVVVMTANYLGQLPINSVDNTVNWGFVNLSRLPQATNFYLW